MATKNRSGGLAAIVANASMLSQPLSVKIEPGRVDRRRFWWSVWSGARIVERSPHSLATRSEAENEAADALKRAKNRLGVQ